MAAKDKDTIYIDVDDEITGIIDKLQASSSKVVALVLPKRAAVFQSIVNMKLLKRAADSGKKNLVLITAEAGLLPLAGAAGIHVAKTLTSKPEIPTAPAPDLADETVPETPLEELEEPLADKTAPIGELAGANAAKPPADGVETLTLPDEDLAAAAAPGGKTFEPPAKKKNKKLRVPNFDRFRLWLIIAGGLLLLLILFLIFMTVAGAKATINIATDATNVNTNLNLGLSTTAKSLDPVNNILPAKLAQEQKTYTQQVATTGQKNNGNKASGTVTMSAQECAPNLGTPSVVPAGTGLSANGQTYITQEDTSFSDFGKTKGSCATYQASGSTPIQAQSGGASFNVSGVNFAISGRSDVTADGSASGGTDNIVQTVNQNDINNAKSKITVDDTQIKKDLQSQLKGENLYPIMATYSAGTPIITPSAAVGQVASSVTVTEAVTYTLFGAKQSDLNTLIDNQIDSQIDTSKQSVLDNGLGQAVFNVNSMSATAAQLNLSTKATAGPHLDVNAIKQQIAGQKAGAIKSQLSGNPDVTSVNVKISPFWVSNAPKKASRITINIAKPKTTVKASSSSAGNP
jgi:hypothetical protein